MQVASKSYSERRTFRKQKNEKPSKRNLGSTPVDPTTNIWKRSPEFYLIQVIFDNIINIRWKVNIFGRGRLTAKLELIILMLDAH